jgi:hypothetical protein
MGLSKDSKVTFREYDLARMLKSVGKTVGDYEVNMNSFGISSLKKMEEAAVLIPNLDLPLDSGDDGLDLPGGGDPPELTLELYALTDADQWKNAIEKEMAIVKPAFAFCDCEHNMTDVNICVEYQVDDIASHQELDDDNVSNDLTQV